MRGSLFALLAAASLAGAGCKKDGCDEKILDKVLAAVPEVAAADRTELVAQGLGDACTNPDAPMPAGLTAALQGYREWQRGIATGLILKAIGDSHDLWTKGCPAGQEAVRAAIETRARHASLELARACAADTRGFASLGEFSQAHLSAVALSILTHAWLADGGTDKVRAHRLARAMLGI